MKFLESVPTPVLLAVTIIIWILAIIIRVRRAEKFVKEATEKAYGYYTAEEVLKHNKEGDLWLIIKNRGSEKHKVYDVSTYVDDHPGGYAIFNHAGKDSTIGFLGPQHPENVSLILEEYLIGEVIAENEK